MYLQVIIFLEIFLKKFVNFVLDSMKDFLDFNGQWEKMSFIFIKNCSDILWPEKNEVNLNDDCNFGLFITLLKFFTFIHILIFIR
jgi:hypothetical protein